MRVYPIPSGHNPIEILKFICVQFTARMEVIVVAQRGALICPDYKLTILKNDIGKTFSGKGTVPLETTSALHSWTFSSDILSKPWRHFVNERIIQPHVDKYARVRSDDDSRLSALEDEECDEESAPAPAGGDRGEVPAMRKASKLQPPLEEGKCRQRSPSPPHRRLRSQHSSESAARTCHHAARGRAQHAAAQWVRLRIPQVRTRACSLGASVALFAAALSRALPLPLPGDLICTAGCPTDA